MRKLLPLFLVALSASAFAQDNDAIPYPEQQYEEDDSPRTRRTSRADSETRASLSGLDDPSKGISAELLANLFLLESSRGAGVDPRFGWGARFTWEFGRLFSNDFLHESLFLDGTWVWTSSRDGTTEVNASTNYHYFTLAPSLGIPFGSGSPVAFYAQVGGGVTYQYGIFNGAGVQTLTSGIKPTFLYGAGIRGRPLLSEASGVRLVFRVEVTRFRRGYIDDTYVGGSLGLGF